MVVDKRTSDWSTWLDAVRSQLLSRFGLALDSVQGSNQSDWKIWWLDGVSPAAAARAIAELAE